MRIGSQTPRQSTHRGEVAYSDGENASMLISDLGMDLFAWQKPLLSDWCARDSQNMPSYVTCGLDVPRQNGKNAILEAYEMFVLAICGWRVLHTAHRVKTTKESFRRLVRYFTDTSHPEISERVDKIRYTNGEEAIYLTNGGSIEFASRTSGAARGYANIQLLVFDEAQELTDVQYNSIMYTLAASATGERQLIYTGTPPYEGCPGTVFSRLRSASLNVTPAKNTWSSWAIDFLPRRDVQFEDLIDEIYKSNPSMGLLLDLEFTENEFAGGDIVGFSQERLDWWSPLKTIDHAIPKDVWDKTAIEKIGDKYKGKQAFGVKFAPDGSYCTIAGCKLSTNGNTGAFELLETFDTALGTMQIAQYLLKTKNRTSCVVIDGLSGADALCEALSQLHAPRNYVMRPNAGDVVSSAVNLLDGLKTGSIKHTRQDDLDRSATQCVKRPIGKRGGWGFGSTESTSSVPIEACALALSGARKTRRNPRRKQRLL